MKAIPDGYTAVTPVLALDRCGEMIENYKNAFGAVETVRIDMPDGSGLIMHAVIEINGSKIMLSDAFAGCPSSGNGTIFLYVDDVDAVLEKAQKAGMTVTMPAEDMFWGDRMGNVRDQGRVSWSIASHQRDVSPEEIEKGAKEMAERMKAFSESQSA